MPHYFFHVIDGYVSIDHVGVDLANAEAAQREAVRTAGEMIRDGNIAGDDWTMTVVDKDRVVVMRLTFKAMRESLRN